MNKATAGYVAVPFLCTAAAVATPRPLAAGDEKSADNALLSNDMIGTSADDKGGTHNGLEMQRKARRKKMRSRRSQRTNARSDIRYRCRSMQAIYTYNVLTY